MNKKVILFDVSEGDVIVLSVVGKNFLGSPYTGLLYILGMKTLLFYAWFRCFVN